MLVIKINDWDVYVYDMHAIFQITILFLLNPLFKQ